jgi:hypothetical protein
MSCLTGTHTFKVLNRFGMEMICVITGIQTLALHIALSLYAKRSTSGGQPGSKWKF